GAGCSRVKARMTAIPLARPPIASRRLGVGLRAAMSAKCISVCERTEEGPAAIRGARAGLDGRGMAVQDDSYNEQAFAIRNEDRPRFQSRYRRVRLDGHSHLGPRARSRRGSHGEDWLHRLFL